MEVRPSFFLHTVFTQKHQVVNPRAALLSNYEVFKLLKELEAENLSRAKASLRIKKDEDSTSTQNPAQIPSLEASENLRTIEVEVSPFVCTRNNDHSSLRRRSNTSNLTIFRHALRPKQASLSSRRTSVLSA